MVTRRIFFTFLQFFIFIGIIGKVSPVFSNENIFYINENNLPEIKKLSSTDVIFKQFERTVMYNEKKSFDSLNSDKIEMEFYLYVPKKSEDLFSVSAASSIPYDTIATLNSISSISEKIDGKKIILPVVKGIFVSEKPSSFVENLIYSEVKGFVANSFNLCYYLNGRKFYFLKDKRFSASERAFFLDSAMRPPLENIRVTSSFGMRNSPIYKKWKNHNGVDFAAKEGTHVFACKNGKVSFVAYMDSIFGNYIVLLHENGLSTVYAHLSKINVKKGDFVRTGDLIGFTGSTGSVTGPHLHFEVRQNGVASDPADFFSF